MEEASVHARVIGHVQGVGFRVYTARAASRLGLRGWVRNLPDGSVETEAAGPRPGLVRFLAAIEAGPPASHVDEVIVRWGPAPESPGTGFDIRT